MRKLILASLFGVVSLLTSAQIDTTISLISKMDINEQYELHDGNLVHLMGFTILIGAPIKLPSPTLNLTEGDSVRLNLWNLSQGPPHTIHLHGLDVDQANDGVPMLSFEVEHDDTGSYYFKVPHPGTYLYHCHVTSVVHLQSGMYGPVIVRPASADTLTWENGYSFHSETTWMMSELDTNWHHDSIINHPHDPMDMTHLILDYAPQHFLINGKSEQQLAANNIEIVGAQDEIIYLRLINTGYYGNRLYFPSELNALIIDSDGRPLPSTIDSDSLEILPGERYGVLLESAVQLTDAIQVDYFDLNTNTVVDTQFPEVTIEGFVGQSEIEIDPFQLSIFPNPSSSKIHVELNSSSNDEIEFVITNSLGQVISNNRMSVEPGIYEFQIDGEKLENGVYYVKISTLEHQVTKQFVIQ